MIKCNVHSLKIARLEDIRESGVTSGTVPCRILRVPADADSWRFAYKILNILEEPQRELIRRADISKIVGNVTELDA